MPNLYIMLLKGLYVAQKCIMIAKRHWYGEGWCLYCRL